MCEITLFKIVTPRIITNLLFMKLINVPPKRTSVQDEFGVNLRVK